jgi:biopolymer transport protein ExbD
VDAARFGLVGTGYDDLIVRKPSSEPPEFDITAMVDLVFMMNIYFLVTFVTVALSGIDLPSASHVAPLDAESSVVLTVTGGGAEPVVVYLGDREEGEAIRDVDQQEDRIRAAVEQGLAEGKHDVLLKAEKTMRLGDMFRISSAASSVEGVKLSVAVMEKDRP